MEWDLGFQGLGLLIIMSLGFGAIAQALAWSSGTHWLWLIGAVAWFLGGLFMSEVVFAGATEGEVQPVIDGLALDESALGGLVLGVPVALVTWYLTRRRRPEQPIAS